jgi:hypothetical protein
VVAGVKSTQGKVHVFFFLRSRRVESRLEWINKETTGTGTTALDEVKEIITLPTFDLGKLARLIKPIWTLSSWRREWKAA